MSSPWGPRPTASSPGTCEECRSSSTSLTCWIRILGTEPSNCVSTWLPGCTPEQWGLRTMDPVVTFLLFYPNPRVFQQQRYYHFGLASPLLWETVLCILECEQHPLLLSARWQQQPPTQAWQWQMSAAIAKLPLVGKHCLGKCSKMWRKRKWKEFFLIYQFHLN